MTGGSRSSDGEARIELGFKSKTDLVTELLRQELQAGKPGPGQRLVVSQVAARLGVSKVPVREAVTRLIGEGLLQHKPNIGPVVPAFTADEVYETALMRAALESVASQSALPRHDAESLALLEKLFAAMEAAGADYPELNVQFHAAALAPTPYREMFRSIEALLARARRYAIVHSVPGYRDSSQREHRELLELARRCDVEGFNLLNEQHILGAASQLITQMRTAEQASDSPGQRSRGPRGRPVRPMETGSEPCHEL
jgi:DNA-binding GntR family transcriptional regulator